MGLRCQASTSDPCLLFVFRAAGSAAGAFATQIDDILGRGEPDVLAKMRACLEQRFGELNLRELSFVHVSMEIARGHAFSATRTQSDFAQNLQSLLTTPKLWGARQKLPSPEDVHPCQCKLGELCWLPTV